MMTSSCRHWSLQVAGVVFSKFHSLRAARPFPSHWRPPTGERLCALRMAAHPPDGLAHLFGAWQSPPRSHVVAMLLMLQRRWMPTG
jgi:hypothetical protein